MRITFLHPQLDFSDGTARLISSVRATVAAGHEVSVIARKGSRSVALRESGANCLEAELPTRRWLGVFAASRTRQQVAELAPDLLHATDASLANVAAKVADSLECPYILEVSRPFQAPLRVIGAQLRAVLLPCTTFIEKAVNRGNVPRALLRVIEHGPELEADWRPRAPIESRRPVLIALGTLDHDHGFDLLLDVADRLAKAGRKLNYLIVGEGPEEDRLRRRVRELDLCDSFTITSPALADVVTAIEQADLHIACLRGGSPGWSALRALGMGIPSVISAVSSTFPLIEDRVDGLLVPPGDAGKFAESVALLLDNPRAARQMGVKAHQRMLGQARNESFRRELAELHAAAMGVVLS